MVVSGKGGVGKSCLTVTIGRELARLGYRTLLIEMELGLGTFDLMMNLERGVCWPFGFFVRTVYGERAASCQCRMSLAYGRFSRQMKEIFSMIHRCLQKKRTSWLDLLILS